MCIIRVSSWFHVRFAVAVAGAALIVPMSARAQQTPIDPATLEIEQLLQVLTVGETTAFLREGGIVRVFRSDNRRRLQINNKGAEAAGLKISSRLLQLADQAP